MNNLSNLVIEMTKGNHIGGLHPQQQQQQPTRHRQPKKRYAKKKASDPWTRALNKNSGEAGYEEESPCGDRLKTGVVYDAGVESTTALIANSFTTTIVVNDNPVTQEEKEKEELALFLMLYPILDISTVGAVMAITVDTNSKPDIRSADKLPIKFVGKFTILFYRNIYIMRAFLINVFKNVDGDVSKIGPKAMGNILTGMGDVIVPTTKVDSKLARIWHPANRAYRFDSGSSKLEVFTKARRAFTYESVTKENFLPFILAICAKYKDGYVEIEETEADVNALQSFDDLPDEDYEDGEVYEDDGDLMQGSNEVLIPAGYNPNQQQGGYEDLVEEPVKADNLIDDERKYVF